MTTRAFWSPSTPDDGSLCKLAMLSHACVFGYAILFFPKMAGFSLLLHPFPHLLIPGKFLLFLNTQLKYYLIFEAFSDHFSPKNIYCFLMLP